MRRWTQDRDVPKLKYEPARDPKGRGWHYVWEAGGFGVQVFRNGRRKWMQCGSLKDPLNGKWKSYFRPLGDVADIKLADARAEGGRVKADARRPVARRNGDAAPARGEVSAAGVPRLMSIGAPRSRAHLESDLELGDSSLEQVLRYYEANRNCAPVSKSSMASLVRRHLSMWLNEPILSIDATMLQVRYKEVIAQIKAEGIARAKQYSRLSAPERLLRAPDGYFTGIKTANDVIEGLGRIYRYWTTKHLTRLQRAGVLVPACPTVALLDDLEPEPQRVKGIPLADLRTLIASFETYQDNALHPLLVRFLLASGLRVGITMGCKREYIKDDRIVIPADAERSKVRWKKRHLEHMAYIIPITPEVSRILDAIKPVAPSYGDAETWLFPSRTSDSGHMQEERAAAQRLRRHAVVRFTMHQIRHNVATAAEEVGFRKSEVGELLNHTNSTVTDRYIDERVKRHREMPTAINEHFSRLLFEPAPDIHRPASDADGLTGTSSLAPSAAGRDPSGVANGTRLSPARLEERAFDPRTAGTAVRVRDSPRSPASD
jgi:integrase